MVTLLQPDPTLRWVGEGSRQGSLGSPTATDLSQMKHSDHPGRLGGGDAAGLPDLRGEVSTQRESRGGGLTHSTTSLPPPPTIHALTRRL